jgi:hypothetical protein
LLQSFSLEKALLLGNGDRDLVTDVIIAVGNQNRLIKCAHSDSSRLNIRAICDVSAGRKMWILEPAHPWERSSDNCKH